MKNKAFTLIEFLIYIAILSFFLVLVSGFFWNIVFGNIKESSYQEVQQNGRFALTKIIQETKKATGINSPLPGFSSDTLSLTIAAANLNPTVFKLTNGKLTIAKGNSGTYELTSDQVKVSNLQFTNLSYPNTPGTVRIEMTIEYLNPSGRMEYQASINLKSTVSLVSGGAAP